VILTGGVFDAFLLVGGAALRLCFFRGLLRRLRFRLRRGVFLGVLLDVFFTFRENPRQHTADRDHVPFFGGVCAEGAVGFGLEIEIHLVGLDLGDRLAFLHGVARLFVPLDDLSLGHRVARFGHDQLSH
jgi:hypothetical protein